jgi:fucose 4-O-acetylase-like acetyltransferase
MPEGDALEGDRLRINLELSKIDASRERFLALFRFLNTLVICATILGSIAVICWAIVRIVDQPPWLTLVLAIVGPSGLIALIFHVMTWKANRDIKGLHDKVKSQDAIESE